jgi:ABC-2 type transport system ATP-binding protein
MLEANRISKSYKHKPILTDVDFTLNAGQIYGVAGHNGSGKSTLLSIVAQTLPPDKGDVLFEGVSLKGNRTLAGSILSFVPQENSLLDDLTIREVLVFWGKVYSLPTNKLFAPSSPAVMLGLEQIQKKRISQLSGGMQKRVSIAIALLREPRVLILDEALAALDRTYRVATEAYLDDFCGKGGSVLYCSHDVSELMRICNRILVLRNGKKIFDDDKKAFPSDPQVLDNLLNPVV